MNNYDKYLKYRAKYNLFLGGNKINTMKDLFNLHFDNNWILTGSEAIKKYLEHFNISKFDFPTNDVDIFYVSANELSSRMIGSYKRKQERPERSMTFSNDDSSFDISIVRRPLNYYLIDGIRLDTPSNMLDNYEENLELRNNPIDNIKIDALREIIKVINPDDKLRLALDVDDSKKRKLEDNDEALYNSARAWGWRG